MGKTLFISDFDDTLVTTNAQIIVTDKDGKVRKLTPAEYAVYEKEDGDQFDYSEFQDLIDPKPIPRYVRTLKRAAKSNKVDKVAIRLGCPNRERCNLSYRPRFLPSCGEVRAIRVRP